MKTKLVKTWLLFIAGFMSVSVYGQGISDESVRETILDFTERLRIAYNTHDKQFLDSVFSEDKLIITGHVVERRTADGIRLPDKIEMKKQTKKEYLDKLFKLFDKDKKNLIRVTFDDIKIRRHPERDKIYGVTLHQEFTSGIYHDDGCRFFLWDLTDEQNPMIHVIAWQPDPISIDGKTKTRIDEDEIFFFCIEDFPFIYEQE